MKIITLANLATATAQEVFEQSAKHLLAQNKRAMTNDGSCQYRLRELKCAAGVFIADDEYKLTMERNSWDLLVRAKVVPKEHESLICQLQHIHDQTPPNMWKEELILLGINGLLKTNFIKD